MSNKLRNLKPTIYHYSDNKDLDLRLNFHTTAFNTMVDINKVTGRFTIVLLPSQDRGSYFRSGAQLVPYFQQHIAPMDLMLFQFNSPEPYFMGVVDAVSPILRYGPEGNMLRSITISGTSGKPLNIMPLLIDDIVVEKVINSVTSTLDVFNKIDETIIGPPPPPGTTKTIEWDPVEVRRLIKFAKEELKEITAETVGQEFLTVIKNLFKYSNYLQFPVQWGKGDNRNKWSDFIYDDFFEDKEKLIPKTPKYLKQYPREVSQVANIYKARTLAEGLKMIADPTYYESWSDTLVINGLPYWVHRFRPKPFDRLDDYLPINVNRKYLSLNSLSIIPAEIPLRTIREAAEDASGAALDTIRYADYTWDNLKTFVGELDYWTIEEFDNLDLNISDANVYSVYNSSYSMVTGKSERGVIEAIVDPAAILKYGYRQMDIDISTFLRSYVPESKFSEFRKRPQLKRYWDNPSKTDNSLFSFINPAGGRNLLRDRGNLLRLNQPTLTDVGGTRRVPLVHGVVTGVEIEEATGLNLEYSRAAEKEHRVLKRLHMIRSLIRLVNWNNMNSQMSSGTLTMPVDDKIRCGDKVFIPEAPTPFGEPGIFAYVTAVVQRWSIEAGGKTTLTLERGHNDSMRRIWQQRPSIDAIRKQSEALLKLAYTEGVMGHMRNVYDPSTK